MITKQKITACISMVGQYGIQYPNHKAAPLVIPAGSSLSTLNWIGGGDWQASTLDCDGGTAVVWIKKEHLK
jgi:hypothetical protein